MKQIVFIAFLVIAMLTGCGQASSLSFYNQESQIIRTEYDGTYVIRSSAQDKNAQKALKEAQKTAVYDVIFKGVAAGGSHMEPLKPILLEINAEDKYAAYFNAFFKDDGEYENYITIEDKRTASSVFRRNYQQVMCQTNVTVDVVSLKRKLKEDNIIK